MTQADYPYIGGDPLEDRHSYTYTSFSGQGFLDQWRAARQQFLTDDKASVAAAPNDAPSAPEALGESVVTAKLLEFLAPAISDDQPSETALFWLRWIIKRFEVSKRLHNEYRIAGAAAKGDGNYRNLRLYLSFADCLVRAENALNHLPSLNALIKCLDTICSFADNFSTQDRQKLNDLIRAERKAVEQLIGVTVGPDTKPSPAATRPDVAVPKVLDTTTLVVADTLRSRGYVQALKAHGFVVPKALIIKASSAKSRWGQSNQPPAPTGGLPDDFFIPDLRIPLETACGEVAQDVKVLTTGTVNCDAVSEYLSDIAPELVIFSGFGGEIVREQFLENSGATLHMHAGWLPDYRGSTTIYYSMLREGCCGVSAILLNREIDTGPIVCRKLYPKPPAGMEIDYLYDSVMRSDVLVDVLQQFHCDGKLPSSGTQDVDDGETYYIIHPVLKHVAILNNLAEKAR